MKFCARAASLYQIIISAMENKNQDLMTKVVAAIKADNAFRMASALGDLDVNSPIRPYKTCPDDAHYIYTCCYEDGVCGTKAHWVEVAAVCGANRCLDKLFEMGARPTGVLDVVCGTELDRRVLYNALPVTYRSQVDLQDHRDEEPVFYMNEDEDEARVDLDIRDSCHQSVSKLTDDCRWLMVDSAMSHGADPSFTTRDCCLAPIFRAATNGYAEIVSLMLPGADIPKYTMRNDSLLRRVLMSDKWSDEKDAVKMVCCVIDDEVHGFALDDADSIADHFSTVDPSACAQNNVRERDARKRACARLMDAVHGDRKSVV